MKFLRTEMSKIYWNMDNKRKWMTVYGDQKVGVEKWKRSHGAELITKWIMMDPGRDLHLGGDRNAQGLRLMKRG
jgi:hypothetical protein